MIVLFSIVSCLVPVRRLSRLSWSMHFGDVSETNSRETPRQKQNAHACDICFVFFKMADFLELLKMLKTAGNYGFKTLADTWEIVDRLLPT